MSSTQISVASQSPRRHALLDQIGVRYQVIRVDVPEVQRAGEDPEAFVRRLALEKARAGDIIQEGVSLPVLGADTAVVLDGAILGKPKHRTDGLEMLARLSDRTHTVWTAVALVSGREVVHVNKTRVRFRAISASERAAYWATGEPHDKAGAYGIQGLGAMFIPWIEGSFSSVMGLPLYETVQLLKEFSVPVLERPSPSPRG